MCPGVEVDAELRPHGDRTLSAPHQPSEPLLDLRTIGITIPLPDPFRSQLQGHRASYGDPAADTIPPHITLLGPTQVSAPSIEEIIEHVAAVAARYAPFVIELNGTGTFRPISPVVFVRLIGGIEECSALETALRAGPVQRQLDFDHYHPHVTVAHNVDDASLDRAARELADFTGSFTAHTFELGEMGKDESWQTRCVMTLGGQAWND